jgi:transcriptional regulator with XRE-family HTH domain
VADNQAVPLHHKLTEIDRLLFLRRNHGVQADVARELRVTRQSVSQVYHGVRTSRRISARIDAKIRLRRTA